MRGLYVGVPRAVHCEKFASACRVRRRRVIRRRVLRTRFPRRAVHARRARGLGRQRRSRRERREVATGGRLAPTSSPSAAGGIADRRRIVHDRRSWSSWSSASVVVVTRRRHRPVVGCLSRGRVRRGGGAGVVAPRRVPRSNASSRCEAENRHLGQRRRNRRSRAPAVTAVHHNEHCSQSSIHPKPHLFDGWNTSDEAGRDPGFEARRAGGRQIATRGAAAAPIGDQHPSTLDTTADFAVRTVRVDAIAPLPAKVMRRHLPAKKSYRRCRANELERTALRIREAHAQEDRGRMLSTTKLAGRAACLALVSRWLTRLTTQRGD